MIKTPAIKYGLYLSAFLVLLNSLIYIVDKGYLFSFSFNAILPFVVSIVFMVMAAREEKGLDADGLLSYGEAVRVTFLVKLIAAIAIGVFSYILFNLDPDLVDILKEESIRKAEEMAGMFTDKENLPDIRAEMEQQDFSYGFSTVLIDLVGSLVLAIITALIVSLFVKKSE